MHIVYIAHCETKRLMWLIWHLYWGLSWTLCMQGWELCMCVMSCVGKWSQVLTSFKFLSCSRLTHSTDRITNPGAIYPYTLHTHTHTTHTQFCCSVLTLTVVSLVCRVDSWGGLRDVELLHHESLYCLPGPDASNCRRLIWQLMIKQHSSSLWGNNPAAWEK